MAALFILLGLGLLVLGGEFLVRGASGLALKMRITPLIVGLTVVSFATSAPELIVSIQASMGGHPDIAIGNVVGSNIANIGLILGLTAVFFALPATWLIYRFDWWVMVAASLLLWLFLLDRRLVALEGLVLVGGLVAYLLFKIRDNQRARVAETDLDPETARKSVGVLVGLLIIAIAALRYGAEFLVTGAVSAAMHLGVDERVVSLTVVAFGTSIPELAASIIAAFKGEREIAIGNVIGSNIFNILSVLGVSSLITDIPVTSAGTLGFDIWWMLGFALMIYPLMKWVGKESLSRVEGIILAGGYVGYVYFLIS